MGEEAFQLNQGQRFALRGANRRGEPRASRLLIVSRFLRRALVSAPRFHSLFSASMANTYYVNLFHI